MRTVAIILILYAAPMVLRGSMELGHDLLHYLAAHHHASVHDHPHHEHHGIKDHSHGPAQGTFSNDADSGPATPALIGLFLFFQQGQTIAFDIIRSQTSFCANPPGLTSIHFPPNVPPPWLGQFQ